MERFFEEACFAIGKGGLIEAGLELNIFEGIDVVHIESDQVFQRNFLESAFLVEGAGLDGHGFTVEFGCDVFDRRPFGINVGGGNFIASEDDTVGAENAPEEWLAIFLDGFLRVTVKNFFVHFALKFCLDGIVSEFEFNRLHCSCVEMIFGNRVNAKEKGRGPPGPLNGFAG